MNSTPIRSLLDDIRSPDRAVQGAAFSALMGMTETTVDWSYEAWEELVGMLADESNRVRAIAAQLLCNLARSDPEERMLTELDRLVAVTRDERFVTARHCLQALWKVGAAGERQKQLLVAALRVRFDECESEKNGTLIRYDIIEALRKLYDSRRDESVRDAASALIATVGDPSYSRKYGRLWRGV